MQIFSIDISIKSIVQETEKHDTMKCIIQHLKMVQMTQFIPLIKKLLSEESKYMSLIYWDLKSFNNFTSLTLGSWEWSDLQADIATGFESPKLFNVPHQIRW